MPTHSKPAVAVATPVRVFELRLHCPCGVEMRMSEVVCATNPPTYTYTCPECHYQYTSEVEYPSIRYEP